MARTHSARRAALAALAPALALAAAAGGWGCGAGSAPGEAGRASALVVPIFCPPPFATCPTSCADLSRDPSNCGACGRVCAAGAACVAGQCTAPIIAPTTGTGCPEGFTLCGLGGCRDLRRDPGSCGACGLICAPGETCFAGGCRPAACGAGLALCAVGCADLSRDRGNCGACGVACPTDLVCASGICQQPCPFDFVRCGAACIDVRTDAANCGACGNTCPRGGVCVSGSCF